MTIPDLFKVEKHTVWDNPVPIVDNSETKSMDIYLTDEIGVPFNYNELTYCIKNAPADYDIRMHISTPGGVIDGALFIIDAINLSKAKVTGYLTGTVASAGTIIALACHELVVANHLSFMIHNYSATGISGKGHEIKAYQNFTNANIEKTFRTFYKGFLTDKEMNSVIDGQDIWMNEDEVARRWAIKLEGKSPEVSTTTTAKRGRPKKSVSI